MKKRSGMNKRPIVNFKFKPKLNSIYKLRKNQLLYPEGIVTLNDTAFKILSLCNGTLDIPEIKEIIFQEYFSLNSDNFTLIDNDIDESFLNFYDNNWIH